MATIAFYGPDARRATKVVVSIIPSEHADVGEMHDWQIVHGDVRNDPAIAAEMVEFMDKHGVLSVVMSDGLMGCPHQTGIDYDGEWCPDPACAFCTAEIDLRERLCSDSDGPIPEPGSASSAYQVVALITAGIAYKLFGATMLVSVMVGLLRLGIRVGRRSGPRTHLDGRVHEVTNST